MKPFLALPKIVLFYALPQVLSPFTRSAKESLLNVAFIHEISCQKKAEEDVSPLWAPRLAVGIISLSFRIYCSIGGVQQQATRVSLQTADLYFLPPLHMATLYPPRISFTSQTSQESQRLQPTSPLIAMTKTLFFSSRRRSCCRVMPFSHTGGQVSPHNRHRFPKE